MLIILLLNVAIIKFIPVFSDSDGIYKSKSSDDYVPCERGWHYFRDNCYRVARRNPERFNWEAAVSVCRGYGGDLVSIHSQEEKDFIQAYLLLDVKWWAWIGLNDRDEEGNFKWSDGSVFNYSNWKPNEPSGRGRESGLQHDDEDCVHLYYDYRDNDYLGLWNDRKCDAGEYAFCKMGANPRKRSPNLMYCSPQEGGGWKYENSCFHIVTEMKTWENAEKHCKNYYNGHLLTIRDTFQDVFLELALPEIEEEIWIGIKIQNQLQQKWASGWYVSYERFDESERYTEGTCAARVNRKEWIPLPCTTPLPFICEVSKDSPPLLKPSVKGAHCPQDLDDWRDLGGDYCYYISETVQELNFYESSFECQSRGGNLLSLHSEEEARILQPFMRYRMHNREISIRQSFFIGLIRHKANNGENFGWTDGSEFSYQNWKENEPNTHEEKCVEVDSRTMKWNDVKCDYKLPFMCSVKKIVPISSLVDVPNECDSFCIAPDTYLHGLLSQFPEAKRMSCKKI